MFHCKLFSYFVDIVASDGPLLQGGLRDSLPVRPEVHPDGHQHHHEEQDDQEQQEGDVVGVVEKLPENR